MSAADAAIQEKVHGLGNSKNSGKKAVRFSNKDLDDMTKIVKALADSDVLMKGITETLKNDIKKGGALPLISVLLGTLRASLLTGRGLFRAGKGMYRAGNQGQGIKKKIINAFSSFNKL